jgi:hypothetical protein
MPDNTDLRAAREYPTSRDDAAWRRTEQVRLVPVHGVSDFIGKTTREGLVTGTSVQRYRTERMWMRVWAEHEWRPE